MAWSPGFVGRFANDNPKTKPVFITGSISAPLSLLRGFI
jgi:hypothetical protein